MAHICCFWLSVVKYFPIRGNMPLLYKIPNTAGHFGPLVGGRGHTGRESWRHTEAHTKAHKQAQTSTESLQENHECGILIVSSVKVLKNHDIQVHTNWVRFRMRLFLAVVCWCGLDDCRCGLVLWDWNVLCCSVRFQFSRKRTHDARRITRHQVHIRNIWIGPTDIEFGVTDFVQLEIHNTTIINEINVHYQPNVLSPCRDISWKPNF